MTLKDKTLRWRPEPYKAGRNSLGLRNREIVEKGKQFRILFLEDSLVQMGEASSGKLYMVVVEENLNKLRNDTQREIEIINAGILGYTTYQELEFLKIYGLHMKPDMVILCFVFNDVYYKYLHNLKRWDPEILLNRFDKKSGIGPLFLRSYLAHLFVYSLDRIKWRMAKAKGCPNYQFNYTMDFYLAWKDYGWREAQKLIGEMNDILKCEKIKFAIIVFPISKQMDTSLIRYDKGYLFYPNKKIVSIAEKYSIPMFDLSDSLLENGGTTLFMDYLHLNRAGNDIVAAELSKYLIGLVKQSAL